MAALNVSQYSGLSGAKTYRTTEFLTISAIKELNQINRVE
jgi:hypothetical protein